jgi:ketosteroid isomerase-like protein
MVHARNANEQLVIDFFSALSTGDLDLVARYMCEDLSWTTMITGVPGAGRHDGRDNVLYNFLAPVRGVFRDGDPKVVVDALVSSDDRVMAETRGLGQRSDGHPYNNLYAWAFEIRDGKIQHIREYMDSLYVARFFGMDLSEPTA